MVERDGVKQVFVSIVVDQEFIKGREDVGGYLVILCNIESVVVETVK